jgi:hypothetical protein
MSRVRDCWRKVSAAGGGSASALVSSYGILWPPTRAIRAVIMKIRLPQI